MHNILLAKYKQCKEYRDSLSRSDIFIEDTCHAFWGRGKSHTGENMLGYLHQHVKATADRVLLIGSSHVKGIAPLLEEHHGHCTIKEACFPGGQIKTIQDYIQTIDLMQYDYIYVIVGSNNIYTKTGETCTELPTILQDITHLHNYIKSHTLATVKFSSILPRTHTSTSKWSPDIFHSYMTKAIYINNKLQKSINIIKHPQLYKRKKSKHQFSQWGWGTS